MLGRPTVFAGVATLTALCAMGTDAISGAHARRAAGASIGAPAASAEAAEPNDNRLSAGRLSNGVLTVALEARPVLWEPEEKGGPSIPLYAFAESGAVARIPGPLLRVPLGTEVRATVRNALPVVMRLRGLASRVGTPMDSIIMAPGETREVTFRADVAGTFYYWARTESFPLTAGPGILRDAMLLGAFVVDSVGARTRAGERVLVISVWSDTAAALGTKTERADRILRREMVPRERWLVAAINGKSWPHTERFSHTVDDSVHWRVINGSRYPHPMHLHGFYFDVDAVGDAQRDTVYTAARRRSVVTEWLTPGATMSVSWVPTRPGNWLFHCHIVTHVSDANRVGTVRHSSAGHGSHAETMMGGLVTGIYVAPRSSAERTRDDRPRRRLRLFVTERPNVYGDRPGYSYVLQEGRRAPARDSIRKASSTLMLRQNEPTEITVVNVTSQTASIHWHGLELESFYDGVGDWSGWGARTAPAIAAGDSFVVRLTPPRAGTFMYHTHTDEGIQLASGMYGALIVHPERAKPDTTDRVFVLGIDGPLDDGAPIVNGLLNPPAIEIRRGIPHRFRFVGIAPLESRTIQLLSATTIDQWRPVAQDGADLPDALAKSQRATVALHPGQTYDVEILRQRPETLTLRMSNPETIANRGAFLARAKPGEVAPRIVVDIPVIVK